MLLKHSLTLVAALFLVSACAEMGTDATAPGDDLTSFAMGGSGNVKCSTINFGEGFAHGDLVTVVPSGLGFDLTFTLAPGGEYSSDNLRAWDTDTPTSSGFLDTDLMWNGAGALCPDCNGQGVVVIIEDVRGFDPEGDSGDGGTITITGFSGHGTFIVRSYVAIDQDVEERAIRLLVDGVQDGQSSGLGDGSVEVVTPNQTPFTDEVQVVFDGSGAVDDIEICQGEEGAVGRMTGGGRQIEIGDVSVSRGFTIHCDIVLSNNLEINWTGGNMWHLDKPLTSAICLDDGVLDPVPPAAPFDTFIGEGFGRLNGVDGSFVRFTFADAGEPGRNDQATIQIWAPGANPAVDAPVLEISGNLDHGNIQAHFDQPHRNS